MKDKAKLSQLVLCGIFSALIIVMTAIPYTGYITYGPIEITTLHIIVIIASCLLGWKYGAVLGGVWGISCIIRATTNPLWIMFINPLISLLPRIAVGIVAGLIFKAASKTRLGNAGGAVLAAIGGTLTNTVLVLSSMYVFGGMIKEYAQVFEMFKTIYLTVISLNGGVELAAAIIITPLVCKPVLSYMKKLGA